MNKEFIPYEEALALKELGFDEDVCGYFGKENKLFIVTPDYGDVIKLLKAPLYQQAFRWFRDKYDEHHTWRLQTILSVEDYETYEEAELACLKKLIEIVNQNKEDEERD